MFFAFCLACIVPGMAEQSKNAESKPGGTGPTLFYVMLGLIVALLLLFLLLRPRGTEAGPPQQQQKSSLPLVHPDPSA